MIIERLEDWPKEDFSLIFGGTSGVESAALEDGPSSMSTFRDFGRGQVMRVTHCANNDLLVPSDRNVLTFVRRFLLHDTGPGGAASTDS